LSGHQFLINPYGLMFEEITASSLVKVDTEGRKLDDSPFDVNPAGFVIHSAVHAARHDAGSACCTRIRSTAWRCRRRRAACCRCRSSRSSCCPAWVTTTTKAWRCATTRSRAWCATWAAANFLMLRNHGLLTVGASVAAFLQAMYLFETVCTIQVRAQAGGGELVQCAPRDHRHRRRAGRVATRGQGASLTWPGLLRRLDRRLPGYDN
jgi:ribulose-5-phosphate 4-epimerase/fuculose-1-phosphate aldolase